MVGVESWVAIILVLLLVDWFTNILMRRFNK